MRVHVLGSAAGGGFPQWNCNSSNNRRFFSADGQHWVLINASLDVRQQAIAFDGLRAFADAEMQEEVWQFSRLADESGWIETG